jgi:hypothetical protein
MGGEHVIQDRLHHGRSVGVSVFITFNGTGDGERSEGSVKTDSIDRLTGFLKAKNINVPDMFPGRLPVLLSHEVVGGMPGIDVDQKRQPLAGVIPPGPPSCGVSVCGVRRPPSG